MRLIYSNRIYFYNCDTQGLAHQRHSWQKSKVYLITMFRFILDSKWHLISIGKLFVESRQPNFFLYQLNWYS